VLGSTLDETSILVRDEESHESWILNSRMDYTSRISSYEIRDVRGDLVLRMSWPREFSGRTREEFITELGQNRAMLRSLDPMITITPRPGSLERLVSSSGSERRTCVRGGLRCGGRRIPRSWKLWSVCARYLKRSLWRYSHHRLT
jgi:hypothetical protein